MVVKQTSIAMNPKNIGAKVKYEPNCEERYIKSNYAYVITFNNTNG